jgi:integrase
MGRRGFGNVLKLPSGRWRARYSHNGQVHAAPRTFPTKAEATAWLSKAHTEITGGEWVNPVAGKKTLGDFARGWLDGRSDLEETTRAKYAYLLRAHILPKLGDIELARLTAAEVRAWYHELGRKYKSVGDDAYRCLRAVLRTAVADGQLAKSPCTVKGAGGVRAAERPVASMGELGAAVDAMPPRFRAALVLAAWCQLRLGEVLALQRRHVDLAAGVVRVEQAWGRPMGGKAAIKGPKTEAGNRSIGIPSHVLPLVEQHLASVGPAPTAWLFGTSTGTAVSARNFQRAWDKARSAAGRPDLHFHDLRHTGLTWSAETGASLPELMRRGGHASPRAALRYQHATEDRDRVLTDALAKMAASTTRPTT